MHCSNADIEEEISQVEEIKITDIGEEHLQTQIKTPSEVNHYINSVYYFNISLDLIND